MIEEPSDEDWIPPKSRHDEEAERSYHAALSASKEWVETVTKKPFSYPEDVRRSLEDGVVLCELLNCLKPNCIRRINRQRIPMARLDNLNTFFSTSRREFSIRDGYLFDIHDLDDLTQRAFDENEIEFETRKRLLRVAVCLFWIGKASESFYSGPLLDYSAFSSIINDRDRRFAVTRNKVRPSQQTSARISQTTKPTPTTISKPSPVYNNIKKLPSETTLPTFSVKDPTYLTKQAKEQMKMVNDNMSIKTSYELDDEEAGAWQQSLSLWRKRRSGQISIGQDIAELRNNTPQREFNRSYSVPVNLSLTKEIDRPDTNGFNTSTDEDPVFEAIVENDALNSESSDTDEMEDVPANNEEREIPSSIAVVDFKVPNNFESSKPKVLSIDSSTPSKRITKQNSIDEMKINETHTTATSSKPPLHPDFGDSQKVDANAVQTIDDEKNTITGNDRILLLNNANSLALRVSFIEEDLPSELQDNPHTSISDNSSIQDVDKPSAEQKNMTPPPSEWKSTKKYRAPQPPPPLQLDFMKRQTSAPPQVASHSPKSSPSDIGNVQEPAVPPRRRRSHVTPSSDGDFETSAMIKSPSIDSPLIIPASVIKEETAAEDNFGIVSPSVKHERNSTQSDSKNEGSSAASASTKVNSKTTPLHTYPPHVSKKINENFSPSCYSDENLGMSQKHKSLTSHEHLSTQLSEGRDLSITDSHFDQINQFSSQQPYECSVCSKTLCQEVVAIALKELGLQFHVTCFYCWNCKRPLGGSCSSGGLFVSNDRLFCFRCHSFMMGMTVLKLGRF